MFTRLRPTTRSITQTFKRFNSHGHGHGHFEAPEPHVEITMTKIFGVAAAAGAFLYYNDTSKPLFNLKLFDQETSGDRTQSRSENYAMRSKLAFVKEFAGRDKGGVGQQYYRRKATNRDIMPHNLIPAHSPFGSQFGAGVKTDQLGPRRERTRLYAPIDPYAEAR